MRIYQKNNAELSNSIKVPLRLNNSKGNFEVMPKKNKKKKHPQMTFFVSISFILPL